MNLREIAVVAGVSPATVSLVLHGKTGVSNDKRAQIMQLLHENGYSVAGGPSNKLIYFIKYASDANAFNNNPGFITTIMDAVELECRNNGYSLSVATFTNIHQIVEYLHAHKADGVIVLGTEICENDMYEFQSLHMPYVVVDNLLARTPCHAITMDNYAPVFQCVEHLKLLGHKKIGFLHNGSRYSNNCVLRKRAFAEALDYYGLEFDHSLVYKLEPTLNGSYISMCRLLQNNVRMPQALVASCDVAALGALKAFQEYGIRVPQDISLTGFDDISYAEISSPPLTTVKVPCAEIGTWAVRFLQGLEALSKSSPLKLQLGTEFILRESTGAYVPSDNPYILH